eukprot:TRINITY_DN1405_c0_g1_i1.p1 TRINITY_DN1405_c0_g1~~TRINITY_DN1405_c0_g1_i1.p1  ORF type:complete len:441 (+),score=96.97 TRINITY_DN1405_c0_g1_i1:74-1396(+)
MEAHIQTAIECAGRADIDKALFELRAALHLYDNAYTTRSGQEPLSNTLEEQFTMTLFYLSQVHGMVQHRDLASKYWHLCLRRQLALQQQFDAAEWAVNCLGLCAYYLGKRMFNLAEHCLRAVDKVMPSDASSDNRASLHTMWIKFFVARLRYECERSLGQLDDTAAAAEAALLFAGAATAKASETEGESAAAERCAAVSLDPASLMFDSLQLEPVQFDAPVRDFDSARLLLLAATEHLKKAKQFYASDEQVVELLTLVMDESNLYRYALVFETDLDRKLKMLKRRAGLLEPFLTRLTALEYESQLRQALFDLGEIYADRMELRIQQAGADAEKRINKAGLTAIKFWQAFMKTFEQDGRLPDRFDEEFEDAVMAALFGLAKIYGKLISPTQQARSVNLQRSLEIYKQLIAYRDRHHIKTFAREIEVCREMTDVIPAQIARQ